MATKRKHDGDNEDDIEDLPELASGWEETEATQAAIHSSIMATKWKHDGDNEDDIEDVRSGWEETEATQAAIHSSIIATNRKHDGDNEDDIEDEAVQEAIHTSMSATKRKHDSDNEDDIEDLPEFVRIGWEETVTFVVENRKLPPVSRHVLALISPVFDTLFSTEFLDREEKEIPLPGKKYADMLEFMKCIYPNINKPVTFENVRQIIPLASEYQVKGVLKKCEICLLANVENLEFRLGLNEFTEVRMITNLFNCLKIADRYKLEGVKEKCLRLSSYLSRDRVKEAQEIVALPAELLNELQDSRITFLEEKYRPQDQVP